MGQADVVGFLRFSTASLFVNMVVISILAGMVVMAFGTAYTLVDKDKGTRVAAHGAILAGVMIALAALQFGAVPVSFQGVAKLGFPTILAGPVMDAYTTVTGWLLFLIGWFSSLLIAGGAIALLTSRGNGGITWLIKGLVLGAIGSLIGSGGIITLIMSVAGIHAPVVA